VLEEHPADLVVVQGDTSSATMGALAAFYSRVPVAHVEAGLRSRDLANPFPEEGNRRVVDVLSPLLLAPTPASAANLLAEGFPSERIAVTGNTVVDALQLLASRGTSPLRPTGRRLVVVTTHRRESWGSELEEICRAVLSIATRHDVEIAIPVHPNPHVRDTVLRVLGAQANVHLLPPLDYTSFLALLRQAYLVLTDSGGVQEEAPSLGAPVLVMRKTTERSEAIEAGIAKLVGTGYEAIVAAADALLGDNAARGQMVGRANPFGDGAASDRIAAAILNWREGTTPLLSPEAAFGAEAPAYA
jgi:UDP-N-acetylglucosamine 2-epimerase (non-hydrolysing)